MIVSVSLKLNLIISGVGPTGTVPGSVGRQVVSEPLSRRSDVPSGRTGSSSRVLDGSVLLTPSPGRPSVFNVNKE